MRNSFPSRLTTFSQNIWRDFVPWRSLLPFRAEKHTSQKEVINVKKVITIFVSVLFIFALASLSLAAEKAAPAPPMEKEAEALTAGKPIVRQVTGEVKTVDMKAMTVTVTKMLKGKAEETKVTVGDKTKVIMGKEKKALADVKAGDKVTVKYVEAGGKNVAKKIAIHEAEPAKTMGKPAKPTEK
jgi:Cu/Ag efflux protein CusF